MEIASLKQTLVHRVHPFAHFSGFATFTKFLALSSSKTPLGHKSMQLPHPVQPASSITGY